MSLQPNIQTASDPAVACTDLLGDRLPTPPDGFLEQYCQHLVRHWLMTSSATTSAEARATLKHCAKQLRTRIEMAQQNRPQPNAPAQRPPDTDV